MTRQARSLSVRPETYQRFVAAAAARGITVAYLVEQACAGDLRVRPGVLAPMTVAPSARDRFAIEVSAGIHELVGDHVVRHGGEASQVFEHAVVRAIEASEKGWRFEV